MKLPRKKRNVLDLEEKATIIWAVTIRHKKSGVAAEHSIPVSNLERKGLCFILERVQEKIHLKTTPHEKLEDVLFTSYLDAQEKNILLTGESVPTGSA